MTQPADSVTNKAAKPWWRYGLAWLVIGAPAIGVISGLIMLYLAVVGQDPVLEHDYYREYIDAAKDAKESTVQ
jgi:hypothetical protein